MNNSSKMLYTLLCFLPLLLLNCQENESPMEPPITESVIDTFSYLALGDSYTIGESVAETERYPIQLQTALAQEDITVEPVKIIATTGWTTDELVRGIEQTDDLEPTYDLVSLLIGVNNQFRGRPVSTYRPEFEGLLQQAIAFAGNDTSRVFVVSIPDYAFTSFGNGNGSISMGIDEYNAANKEITEQYNVQYFDITPISRRGLEEPELVANDGLHPSGEQYRLWVELMVEEVKAMLE